MIWGAGIQPVISKWRDTLRRLTLTLNIKSNYKHITGKSTANSTIINTEIKLSLSFSH